MAQFSSIYSMSSNVQNSRMGDFRIRGIPEEIHRKLKALAALAGMSFNDYLLEVLKEHVAKKGKLG
jgi:predicted HicB family RNase H-like nuclease